jgi:hypothetical protein
MKKAKMVAGIVWAITCLILILILFPGMGSFSQNTARLPFMKINPNYTGGEVSRQILTGNCTIDIRKPVFDGLLKERKNGFVQIDWRGEMPTEFTDTIDYDLDMKPDFSVTINSSQPATLLVPMNNKVEDVIVSTQTSYGWALRVAVTK